MQCVDITELLNNTTMPRSSAVLSQAFSEELQELPRQKSVLAEILAT